MTLFAPPGFLVERSLGSGASGRVFLANDERLNRRVALKFVPDIAADGRDSATDLQGFAADSSGGDSSAANGSGGDCSGGDVSAADSSIGADSAGASGLGEAITLARIRHPHIVRLFDCVSDPAGIWLVMEYCPGPSLQQVIDGDRPAYPYRANRHRVDPPRDARPRPGRPELDPPRVDPPRPMDAYRAVHWSAQLAGALCELERLDIVHGDIKPANVIVTDWTHCHLLDFGLSVERGSEAPSHGTPAFMAPELLSGGRPSTKSDVYALAVTSWWLLTGEHPFGTSAHWSGGTSAQSPDGDLGQGPGHTDRRWAGTGLGRRAFLGTPPAQLPGSTVRVLKAGMSRSVTRRPSVEKLRRALIFSLRVMDRAVDIEKSAA